MLVLVLRFGSLGISGFGFRVQVLGGLGFGV